MKQVNQLRSLFRFLSFVSILLLIGTAGALESGGINFLQFFLELALFSGLAYFFAALSRRRFILRLHPRARTCGSRHKETPRAARHVRAA